MRRELDHYKRISARLVAALMGKRKRKVIPPEVWEGTAGVDVFTDEKDGAVTIRVEYPG